VVVAGVVVVAVVEVVVEAAVPDSTRTGAELKCSSFFFTFQCSSFFSNKRDKMFLQSFPSRTCMMSSVRQTSLSSYKSASPRAGQLSSVGVNGMKPRLHLGNIRTLLTNIRTVPLSNNTTSFAFPPSIISSFPPSSHAIKLLNPVRCKSKSTITPFMLRNRRTVKVAGKRIGKKYKLKNHKGAAARYLIGCSYFSFL
jgi:hypothetical protein